MLCVSVPSRAALGPHLSLVFSQFSARSPCFAPFLQLFVKTSVCFAEVVPCLCVIFCFLWYFVGGYLSLSRLHTPLCDTTVEAQRVWGLLLIC